MMSGENEVEKEWLHELPIFQGRVRKPNERASQLKGFVLDTKPEVFIEAARLETESYKQTEGEPNIVRRAKAFRKIANGITIKIHEGELIVGGRTPLPRMGIVTPSAAVDWVDRELETLPTRPQDPFEVSQSDIEELREDIFPYWRGNTLESAVKENIPADVKEAFEARVFSLHQQDHAQGHILPNVVTWLEEGPRGIRKRIQEERNRWENEGNLTKKQSDFYQAADICMHAAMEFVDRYAELASSLANEAPSEQRKEELLKISNVCQHISEGSPKGYWESLQSVAFLFILLQMESNASSFSPGRFDQYIYPYLKEDMEKGDITIDEAVELLECFWIKLNEMVYMRHSHHAQYFAGNPIQFNLLVGGQLADGGDATNLVSYLCLQSQADLLLPQPNFSVRLHKGTPKKFLTTVSKVISLGGGMPQLFNDEVIIPAYENRGVDHRDAMNYAVVGCVELSIPGKTMGWGDGSMFNLLRVLEITLHGGEVPETGVQLGPPTKKLEELDTFEDLEEAYKTQLRYFIMLMVKGVNTIDRMHGCWCQTPCLSCVIDDCLRNGSDVTWGGAHYNFSGVQGVQIGNLADCMSALKWAVYDREKVPPEELMSALEKNYEEKEPLRQGLLNWAPKYGNDDDYVDQLGSKWARFFSKEVEIYPTARGGSFHPGFYTVSAHVPLGMDVGATPDGRKAQRPFADGGVSPVAGRDLKGPTAILNSVAKLDHSLISNGALLNLKFTPSFFKEENAIELFSAFLRGFVDLEICHVQFNVISADMLRDAQSRPEDYRGLVVRVAGYSAYFVELNKAIQDEIIARTAHGERK